MKNFLNTMLATAAVVAASTTAYAATGKVAQGFYLGASAGAANTNVKYNTVSAGPFIPDSLIGTTTSTAYQKVTNSNAGKMAGIFGLLAGYNFQSGSLVFGGEIYGGFDSTKVTVSDDTGSGANLTQWSTTVKRTNFMGFAPRLGFMVAPNTLMYARLGAEFGKWKASINPNAAGMASQLAAYNAAGVAGQVLITPAALAKSQQVTSGSKGGMSFAPGLGMEVYMGKAFLRAQYSYLFGPTIKLTQDITGVSPLVANGTTTTHTFKTSQHKVELAVGYKF